MFIVVFKIAELFDKYFCSVQCTCTNVTRVFPTHSVFCFPIHICKAIVCTTDCPTTEQQSVGTLLQKEQTWWPRTLLRWVKDTTSSAAIPIHCMEKLQEALSRLQTHICQVSFANIKVRN